MAIPIEKRQPTGGNLKTNKMIVHRIDREPQDRYCSATELEDYELKEVEALGVDELWYWYESCSYEGSGSMLFRIGDKYDMHDAGHCSCYGPTDQIKLNPVDFDELPSLATEEYLRDFEHLIAAAKPNKL